MLLFGMASLLVRPEPDPRTVECPCGPPNRGCKSFEACEGRDVLMHAALKLLLRGQAASAAVPMGFLGPSLIFMLTYVWSRNFPTTNVSLMGLVRAPQFCSPGMTPTSGLAC